MSHGVVMRFAVSTQEHEETARRCINSVHLDSSFYHLKLTHVTGAVRRRSRARGSLAFAYEVCNDATMQMRDASTFIGYPKVAKIVWHCTE
eukprot:6203461-Pleurochrysis_carterae.AAC.1